MLLYLLNSHDYYNLMVSCWVESSMWKAWLGAWVDEPAGLAGIQQAEVLARVAGCASGPAGSGDRL